MELLKRFFRGLLRLFRRKDRVASDQYHVKKVPRFSRNDKIEKNQLIIVGGEDYNKWAHLICPCGCGEVIDLSLMNSHRPNWSLSIQSGVPSLHPSIWKGDGCRSHFWLKNGKIRWS